MTEGSNETTGLLLGDGVGTGSGFEVDGMGLASEEEMDSVVTTVGKGSVVDLVFLEDDKVTVEVGSERFLDEDSLDEDSLEEDSLEEDSLGE